MRRKKESFIRNLYKQNTDATMACKICGKCLSTDHLGNLKSHLQRKHKSVFDGYKDDEQKISEFASAFSRLLFIISRLLFQSITKRKKMLLSNATVAAAIYLDPRLHRLLLSPEFAHMRVIAVEHLKMLQLKASAIFPQSTQPHSISITESESSIEDTSTDLLGELLNQISSPTCSTSYLSEAYLAIETFNESTDTKTNLADFWERKKFSHTILYQLSQIIHATPSTQVSVERAFSTLRYIVNDYRSNLSDELTEIILLLRLNNK